MERLKSTNLNTRSYSMWRMAAAGLLLSGMGAWGAASAKAQQPAWDGAYGTPVVEPLTTAHADDEHDAYGVVPVVCHADGSVGCQSNGFFGALAASPFSATVELNQDTFFGFYPTLQASYAVTDAMDFTFYSILWTTPDFATNAPGGRGLWTEVGLGLNFTLTDTLTFNPQIGFLNGVLLSGAAQPQAFEGIVPNVTINHSDTWTEAEFYLGYYLATRSPRQNDFLHWWINAGAKPFADSGDWTSIVSAGVHFEHLRLARTRGGSATDLYMWIGPYVQFALPNGLSLWFAGGWDVDGTFADDFYKATVSFSF